MVGFLKCKIAGKPGSVECNHLSSPPVGGSSGYRNLWQDSQSAYNGLEITTLQPAGFTSLACHHTKL